MENIILNSLREKEAKLLEQLEVVRGMIADELRKSETNTYPFTSGVTQESGSTRNKKPASYGKTINQKFLGVLKEKQRFMKVRELAHAIVSIEGGDVDDWVLRLSRRTKKLKELGKIEKFQVGKSKTNVFWGSPNWLEKGNIKSQYQYDERAINEGGRSNGVEDFEL